MQVSKSVVCDMEQWPLYIEFEMYNIILMIYCLFVFLRLFFLLAFKF